MRTRVGWCLPLLVACAAGPQVVPPPARATIPEQSVPATVATPDRREAARAASRAGLMPLHATGIDAFAPLHPTMDGRGVLIAILDSGIDPSVAGLERTSDGRRKILALRDLSGEGRVALEPAESVDDRIGLPGLTVSGRSRVLALASGPIYAGRVAEVQFGMFPGADLSGNGIVGDTLLILVARGTAGWFAMIDSNLNGTIADEVPLTDFDRTGRWSGWSADTSAAPRTAVTVTISSVADVPVVDLVLDADGHGTHVAGIAAGFGLYGVTGFDGVAPGAQLLGLKIAANGLGGVTTTGSVVAAIEFAIARARQLAMPLVINLSFGVGNQREGTAVLDAYVDSVLRANPEVTMSVAAGNDGPAFSTLGFPASASEVLSVGATAPLVFAGLGPGSQIPDPVAHFSSRGGERIGPKVVAPGTAWSSVPRYNAGHEELSGTSMAAPHVAGLVARLYSGERDAGRRPSRARVEQSLLATATPLPFASTLDQGAGVPNLGAAWQYLNASAAIPQLASTASGNLDHNGIWFDGTVLPERFMLRVHRTDGGGPLRLRLRSTVPWIDIVGGGIVPLPREGAEITIHVEPGSHLMPGVRTGTVVVEDADDEGMGVLLRIPVTIRRPLPLDGSVEPTLALQAGQVGREVFDADSARALEITAETLSRNGLALISVHEAGGRPVRDRTLTAAGFQGERGVVQIPGNDVERSRYSIAVVASPTVGVATRLHARQSPVYLTAHRQGEDVIVAATCMVAAPCPIDLSAEWIGAATRATMGGSAALPATIPLPIPAWATSLGLDVAVGEETWSELTDLGVVLRDRAGRVLSESPMTYAFGRMRVQTLAPVRGDTVMLVLAPAAVHVMPGTPWAAQIEVRYLDAAPVAAEIDGAVRFVLAPGERRTVRIRPHDAGRPPEAQLLPLLRLTTTDPDGTAWATELSLPLQKDVTP